MPRFKHYNYDQDAMVVINYQEQLQPGTFEHAVHYLIEHKLDLSVFHPKYRNEDTGRLAYDPVILLKIILFAYSKGITSSREMQWCCETNIIFNALSCDTVPHFTTLAKFVSSHSDEIEELFEQVLLVCHEQGLLGNELFAIDGCKCRRMQRRNGPAPLRNWKRNAPSCDAWFAITSRLITSGMRQRPKPNWTGISDEPRPSSPSMRRRRKWTAS